MKYWKTFKYNTHYIVIIQKYNIQYKKILDIFKNFYNTPNILKIIYCKTIISITDIISYYDHTGKDENPYRFSTI